MVDDARYLNNNLNAALGIAGQSRMDKASKGLAALNDPAAPNETDALTAGKEFEAIFLSQMLSHMFEGVSTDPMFGGGASENIYRSYMIDEYSKILTERGGVGIADHVQKEILKLQEAESHENSTNAGTAR
ncbi:MAG: chemotactic signal-response protein chel [Rickettsiales bacterium]|jgi:Rod binding domain-containing protein|nr:chemotactic signal-response protein chel [Rickettsiales bacterium]